MTCPLVSVVMAVYNGEQYLKDAVYSVMAQTFSNFEFIIIDDGSTDNTPKLLEQFSRNDSRIKIIRQENSGLPAALNRGICEARGKYIARMDADDISLPNRFELQVEFMENNPEIGLCGTACRLIGESSGISWTTTDPDELKCRLLFWPCITHSTVMMRKNILIDNNLFYNPNYKQAEDYELWSRISKVCEIANLPDILLLYRVTASQKSTRFADEVTKWSATVQHRLLEDLGITPTDDEMSIHSSLHKSAFEKSRNYVEKVEQWFCKIIAANKRTHIYNHSSLIRVLMERWRAVCITNADLGIWIWRKYKNTAYEWMDSKSENLPGIPMSSCLRYLLSSRLESTKQGRAIKHAARRIKGLLQIASSQFAGESWWKTR